MPCKCSKLRTRYGLFCEETSIHGFVELFRASTIFWKLSWFLIIATSFAITGYQLVNSVNQFANQEPFTSMKAASELYRPPIKFCTQHFFQWFDFDGLFDYFSTDPELNPNETLLLLVSYIMKIEVKHYFNVSDTELRLEGFLVRENKTVNEMFKKWRVELDRFFFYGDNEKEFIYFNEYLFAACYVCSGKKIEVTINSTGTTDGTMFAGLSTSKLFGKPNKFDPMQAFPPIDNEFIWKFCYSDIPCKNLLFDHLDFAGRIKDDIFYNFKYRLPDILMVDGKGIINLKVKNTEKSMLYTFDFAATARKLISRQQAPCNKNEKIMQRKYSVCSQQCQTKSYSKVLRENNINSSPCESLPILLTENVQLVNFKDVCRYTIVGIGEQPTVDVSYNKDKYQECVEKCNAGCEQWNWDVTVTAEENTANGMDDILNFKYPSYLDILVIEEIDVRTWSDFVANVGGLLGIWTGASILSLLQLIYLFCCPPEENKDKTQINIIQKKRAIKKLDKATP